MSDSPLALFGRTFGRPPTQVSSAPGRIEVIGNHTDYNGGLVVGAAIDRRVTVALRPREDRQVILCSTARDGVVRTDLDHIVPQRDGASWANYPLGVLQEVRQSGLAVEWGFEMAVGSALPVGAGLSSSAAFELATAYALTAAYGGRFDRATLAQLSRRAENAFVGMPCGILDQGVSAFGKADHLVVIDAGPPSFDLVPLPPGTAFWIFNTHTAHALIDSLYATRHRECAEALAHLQPFYPDAACLAALRAEQVEARRADLPDALYRRALHVTREQARVQALIDALSRNDLAAAGRLLFASHESSRTLFENSTPALDFLVEQLSGTAGVIGARLTGGGFGGAVMALTRAAFSRNEAERIGNAYEERFGERPAILACRTADGAGLHAAPEEAPSHGA